MKTIEERAYDVFPIRIRKSRLGIAQDVNAPMRSIYIKGLMEQRNIDEEEGDIAQQENILEALERQKKIDIEKAGLNFCVFCSSYDNCDARYSCETFEKFCKAMES